MRKEPKFKLGDIVMTDYKPYCKKMLCVVVAEKVTDFAWHVYGICPIDTKDYQRFADEADNGQFFYENGYSNWAEEFLAETGFPRVSASKIVLMRLKK